MHKKRGLFILIGIMLIAVSSRAFQQPQSQTNPRFEQLLKQAELNPKQSFDLIKKAEQFSQNSLDSMRLIRAYAISYFANGLIDNAIDQVKTNLLQAITKADNERYREFVQNHLLLQALLDENIDYQSYFEKRGDFSKTSADEKSKELIGFNYLDLGNQSWYSEQYTEAEKWWKKALDYAKVNDFFKLRIKSLHKLGFVLIKKGKVTDAISQYKYIFTVLKAETADYYEDRLLALNALGNAFNSNEKNDSALFYLNKGIELLDKRKGLMKLKGLYHEYKGLLSHNIGNVQLKERKLEKSIAALNQAIKASSLHYGDSSSYLIRSLRDIALAYHYLNKDSLAVTSMQRAVAISKQNHYDQARTYSRMGVLLRFMKQWEAANIYYDSALLSNGSFLIDKKDVFVYTIDLFTIIFGKAEVLVKLGQIEPEGFDELYNQFRETLIFLYQKTDKTPALKYLPKGLDNFYLGFSQLYHKTGDLRWLNQLWDIIEINKAVKLRNRLYDQDFLEFSVPAEVLKEEKTIKDSINIVLGQSRPGVFDSTLFFLNSQHTRFMEQLKEDFPKYYDLKNSLQVTQIKEVFKDLKDNELLLNFFEGDSMIHLISLTPNKAIERKIDKSTFKAYVSRHNDGILNSNKKDILEASTKLIDLLGLNQQIINESDHIYIVPDGIVWSLNFASLSLASGDYLGRETTLSFQYFTNKKINGTPKRSKSMLALAISDGKTGLRQNLIRNGVVDIPGTYAEVTSISNIWDGDSYFGMDATETTFKRNAGNHNLIHLAVHGFEDEHDPENSYLLLSSSDRLNDGRLHAYEIYNLGLQADLAVLSACHSGKGNPVSGEGMMSLGKAFAYAGVSATLVSRWEVSDYSTPILMKYFYSGLKKGMRKSEALRHAQEEYLANHADALTASPFFWSSFYVLGDDKPIYKPADIGYWVVLWAMLVCLSTGLFLKKKRLKYAH